MTAGMLDRLSEWLANLSLLFVGVVILPSLFKAVDFFGGQEIISSGIGAAIALWGSLRLSRISDKKREAGNKKKAVI